MLDSLFGRAELKARIEELEAENDRLERRLDAESERRAEAVTARQNADERANRLEDRIAELNGRIERFDRAEADLDYRGVERLRGARRDAVLSRLRSFEAGPEGALTAAVAGDGETSEDASGGSETPQASRAAGTDGSGEPRSASKSRTQSGDGETRSASSSRAPPDDGREAHRASGGRNPKISGDDGLPDPVREVFGDRAPLVARAAPCLVCADDAGLTRVALVPPLPPDPFCRWGERFDLPEESFRPTGRFGFALVRSDLFAFGVYDGETRRSFEGFESDVMNAHSKGGFSQARFERRRDSQIDEHLDRCREALADAPDPLIVVGERTVLGALRGRATRTAVSDARGDPEAALDEAFEKFWTTRLYRI